MRGPLPAPDPLSLEDTTAVRPASRSCRPPR